MYNEIKIETDNTLAHHGILGMKWGVRRTPEQLGYRNTSNLTKARAKKIRTNAKIQAEMIKRQGKNQAKIEKAEAKAKAVTDKAKEKYDPETKRANEEASKSSTAPQKSIKDMTDDEIMQKIDRLRLEKTLKMTMKELAAMEPPVPENKIKKFVGETMNEVVKPAAAQAGRRLFQEWMEKEGKELLGLNEKQVRKTLDQQVDELRKRKEIAEIQNWFANGGKKEKTLQEQAADRMAEKRMAEVDDWFNKRASNSSGTTDSKTSDDSKHETPKSEQVKSEPTKTEANPTSESKPSGGLKLKSEPTSEPKQSAATTSSKSKYEVPEYERKMDDISLKKYDSPGKKAFKQDLKDLEARSDAEYAAKKTSSSSSSKTSSSGTSYSYDSNKSTSSNGKSYVELLTGSVEGRGSNGGRSEYQLPAVVNTNSNQYALAASSGRTYATYLLEKKR